MGQPFNEHRPLLAGVRVNRGTLTGAAIRHTDRKTLLVTCLHVMDENLLNPDSNAVMHQPLPQAASDTRNRVWEMLEWAPMTEGTGNMVDVALIEPDDGIEISYKIHNPTEVPFGTHTSHDGVGVVIPGLKEPELNTTLTIVGSSSGVVTGRVIDTNGTAPSVGQRDPVTNSIV